MHRDASGVRGIGRRNPGHPAQRLCPPVRHGRGLLPPLLILGSLLFVVRSYRIDGGHLSIRRMFWYTEIPLLGIHQAVHDPLAIKGSLRIFGNGGLFGMTGLYWNKTLGRFRLFATDPAKAVVLRLHGRIVVISPQETGAFLEELGRIFPRLNEPAQAPPQQPSTHTI
jgi:hypothetical protein